jgi:NAD-dependent SIR2 family protein deacetylase
MNPDEMKSVGGDFDEAKKAFEDKLPCDGPIKPCITFFGQALPARFFEAWDMLAEKKDSEGNYEHSEEERSCDLMIVAGTALQVHPFSSTITQCYQEIPKVLMNLENTAHDFTDLEKYPERCFLKGKCDETVLQLCRDLGWTKDLNKLMGKEPQKEEAKVTGKPTTKDVPNSNAGKGKLKQQEVEPL